MIFDPEQELYLIINIQYKTYIELLQELGFAFPVFYNENEFYYDMDFADAVPFTSLEIKYLIKQINSGYLRVNDKTDHIVQNYNKRMKEGFSIRYWHNAVEIYIKKGFDKKSTQWDFIKDNIYKFKMRGHGFGPWVNLVNELEDEIQNEAIIRNLSSKLREFIEYKKREEFPQNNGTCAPGEDAFWKSHYSGDYSDLGGF